MREGEPSRAREAEGPQWGPPVVGVVLSVPSSISTLPAPLPMSVLFGEYIWQGSRIKSVEGVRK